MAPIYKITLTDKTELRICGVQFQSHKQLQPIIQKYNINKKKRKEKNKTPKLQTMALCFQIPTSFIKSQFLSNPRYSPTKTSNSVRICCTQSEGIENTKSNATSEEQKKLSQQSSWEAQDSEGKDYLYRLGAEADNMNIAVGARAGIIDDLFTGNFLGKDCND